MVRLTIPARLKKGDLIGIASPSWLFTPEEYAPLAEAVKELGYRMRPAKNAFAKGWGFAATPEERASSLHDLVTDDDVKMIWFGGGEGGDDVIPYLDYELIRLHPKLWLSFSDGTSILNAVRFRAGLEVCYGLSPSDLTRLTEYEKFYIHAHLEKCGVLSHKAFKPWIPLTEGTASGELSAGYLDNFVYLANGGWITPEKDKKYILCLEEHSMFFGPEHFSDELARLENSPIFQQTSGILFGQYDREPNPFVLERIAWLGEKYHIPTAYSEDFGHGSHHAILRIGAGVCLDTASGTLTYTE